MLILTSPWLFTCRLVNVFFYEENVPVLKPIQMTTRKEKHHTISIFEFCVSKSKIVFDKMCFRPKIRTFHVAVEEIVEKN